MISSEDDDLIQEVQVNALLHSDHHVIICTLTCRKPPPSRVSITSRQYGKTDHKHFSNVLHDRFIDFPECSDPSLLVDSYVEITSSVLDEVCPLVTREHTIKSRLPCYNDIIHAERRNRRRLERKWKKSNSALDKLNFMAQKDHVNKLITDSKIKYFF